MTPHPTTPASAKRQRLLILSAVWREPTGRMCSLDGSGPYARAKRLIPRGIGLHQQAGQRAACSDVRVTRGHLLTRRAGMGDGQATHPHTASHHSPAFTLIEMIVALVLASLMMVGLLGIVLSVSKQSGQLRRDQTDHVAAGVLADRLRDDLINARGIAAGSDTLILSGYVAPQNVPGMIRYERALIGSRRLLIRRVSMEREVCWVDFGAFEFEAYDEFDPEAPVPEMTGGLLPMPARFRIAGRDSEGRLLFDEVIDHHEL
ncbi:hypothetical protein Mal15_69580 [Stieleria maiorica]|uniref:Prepilin-type N-terminal cleavage/methylation domain-containing protein n=1 Tax=Stieleria maiorica TaxID=2795974 RepID=A0A5B9MRV4_9BACT|nr:prepilin-type N-terminal cleavage/methylation domain-containing protein [Stieleria maiorica]QEG02837.1 hypothetical protein Mal15_69580 [Stieleria maiorica]